jgi:metal-responsive CopG/Arc/MetJ family transcriptional regulator
MSKKTSQPDGKTKVSVNIPDRFLNDLDLNRMENKLDRSSWITSAIMEKLASIRKENEIKNNPN